MTSIVRSFAWRIAIGYGALFGLSGLALLAFIYVSTERFVTRQMEAVIEAEVQGLAERYRVAGLRDCASSSENASRATPRALRCTCSPTRSFECSRAI